MAKEILGVKEIETIEKEEIEKQEELENKLSSFVSESRDFLSRLQEEKFSYYFKDGNPQRLIDGEVLLEFPKGINLVFEKLEDEKRGIKNGLKASLENYSFPASSPWQKEKEIFLFSGQNKNIDYERMLISKEGEKELAFESKKADPRSLERLFNLWSQGSEVASKYGK